MYTELYSHCALLLKARTVILPFTICRLESQDTIMNSELSDSVSSFFKEN